MANNQEQLDFFSIIDKAVPRAEGLPMARGSDVWGKIESDVFVHHLKQGELSNALDLLGSMTNEGARAMLCEAGFEPRATGSRHAMLESVQTDLIQAAQEKLSGHELRAKTGRPPVQSMRSFPGSLTAPSFESAVKALQAVLSASEVEVGIAGSEALDTRAALLFIGAQAIERGVSGFGIEGIKGKFQLPDSVDLEGLRALYGASAGVLAENEVRGVLPQWANGRSPVRMSDFVPEASARVIRSPASVDGALAVRNALEDGSIREFAALQGIRMAGQVLREQGVDLMALPVEHQVENAGLHLVTPAGRGLYVGQVVAQDHRASAIKTSRDAALVVAHKDFPLEGGKPKMGASVNVKFGPDMSMQIKVDNRSRTAEMGR